MRFAKQALVLGLFLSACALPSLEKRGYLRFGIQAEVNSSVLLHELDTDGSPKTFIGSLRTQQSATEYVEKLGAQIAIPEAIRSQLPTDVSTPQSLRYSLSILQTSAATGTWYWRAPLLHPDAIELDSLTTVLFEMLSMLERQKLWTPTISRQSWEALYAVALTVCSDCATRSVPAVAKLLSQSQSFLSQSSAILETPPLSADNFASPLTRTVYWFPPSLTLTALENETLQTMSYFWNLLEDDPLPVVWRLDGVDSTTTLPIFSWKPGFASQGTHRLRATYVNPDAEDLEKEFVIEVTNVNQVPAWTTAPVLQRAHTIRAIDLTSVVTDADGDALTFELDNSVSGAVLSGSTLTLTPLNADVGTHTLRLSAIDATGARTPASITWIVTADALPTFTGTSPTTWSLTEAAASSLTLKATDADGDSILIECVTGCPSTKPTPNPAGANSLASTLLTVGEYRFDLTPDYLELVGSANRTSTMSFRARYTGAGMNTAIATNFDVSVTITNADDPPAWNSPPAPPAATENVAYSYSLAATDPNPGATALTYACATKPAWLALNTSTGLLSGTPGYTSSTAQGETLECSVTDTRGLKVEWSGTLTVNNVNRAPTIVSPISDPLLSGGANAREGLAFTYNLSTHFSDPDKVANDPLESLTYSCLNCPTGYVLDSTTGVFSWTPGYSQAGTYTGLVFSVVDSSGSSVSHSAVSVTVDQREGPPLLTLSSATKSVAENASDSISLDVDHYAGDTYGYTVAYSCSPACPAGMVSLPSTTGTSGDAPKSFTITPDYTHGNAALPSTGKTYQITFTASKTTDATLATTQILTLTIQNTNRLPTKLYFNGTDADVFALPLANDGFIPVTNTVALTMDDPDTTNDTYTYSLGAGSAGQIVGTQWQFNPSSYGCWPGGQTSLVTAHVIASDGRGGSITKDITVSITRTSPRGAPCPY